MENQKIAQKLFFSAAAWKEFFPFVLPLSLLVSSVPSYSATALTTNIEITARVLPSARLSVLAQPPSLVVTEEDRKRGFVEVHGTSALELRTNGKGCVLMVSIPGDIVKEMQISINGREVTVNRSESLIEIPVQKSLLAAVNYRFFLSPETEPGSYPWPVSFSISPL